MAFTDLPSRTSTRAMLGLFAATIVGWFTHTTPIGQAVMAQFVTSDQVGDELLRAPGIGQVATALKQSYPDSYARLAERYVKAVRSGESSNAVNAEVGRALSTFIDEHRSGIVKAPGTALQQIAIAQATLIGALHDADVTACAAYARGNTTLATARMDQIGANFAEHNGRLLATLILAAKAGETKPEARISGPPTAEERRTLVTAIENTKPSPTERAVFEGRMRPEEVDDPTICSLENKLRAAIAELPPAAAAPWIVRSSS